MYSPVTRLFTVLDLLQARPSVSAAQLAERLEVNPRSVRRYVTMLQDLGIPIEAVRGRYGGYRLRPGFKLPPLMWTEEEAIAVTLGLQAARQLGLTTTMPALESALAKVERVLPLSLRGRVQALQETIVLDLARPPAATMPLLSGRLSTAAHQQKRVCITYQASSGNVTERDFDCYGLVYHSEHWYAIGYCHLRQATRVFRLERIMHLEVSDEHFKRPLDFDGLSYAIASFAALPARWRIEVLLETRIKAVRWSVPPSFATLTETSEGVLLQAWDDDLEHTARFLINLGCDFQVRQPAELYAALREIAERLLAVADSGAALSANIR